MAVDGWGRSATFLLAGFRLASRRGSAMALGRLGVGFPSDLVARPFAFSHFCPEAGTHVGAHYGTAMPGRPFFSSTGSHQSFQGTKSIEFHPEIATGDAKQLCT